MFRAKFEDDFARVWVNTGMNGQSLEHKESLASARRNLENNIKDERLRQILWPEFNLWCRRVTFHDKFYPALAQPNCELVQEKILRIESNGIRTNEQNSRDKELDPKVPEKFREFDVIICEFDTRLPFDLYIRS